VLLSPSSSDAGATPPSSAGNTASSFSTSGPPFRCMYALPLLPPTHSSLVMLLLLESEHQQAAGRPPRAASTLPTSRPWRAAQAPAAGTETVRARSAPADPCRAPLPRR